MLLRNFYNTLAYGFVLDVGGDTFGDGSLRLKNPSGNLATPNSSGSTYFRMANIAGVCKTTYPNVNYESRIQFGSGTSAVTFDDYKLENAITDLTGSVFEGGKNVAYDAITKKWTSETTFVLSNQGAEAQTISEVGIFLGNTNGSSSGGGLLVWREVLETPFTIEAGESLKYTHTFEFTMP